ncbi:MAG: 3-dehydroquinate synthase [Candidatus Aminicenantales bacterium]
MKKLSFSCSLGACDVYIGDLRRSLPAATGGNSVAMIVSSRVAGLYPWLLKSRLSHLIADGADIKSLDQAKELYSLFLGWKLDRFSVVAAAGGGGICDLVGFVASTYMRGIPFLLMPTTLLAQADAAVGGKTALDWGEIKNVIGTFALPRATLIDPRFLLTLPQPEVFSGLAEVVKHALIASPDLFSFLRTNWARLIQGDLELLTSAIIASVEVKISFVKVDAREANERRLLNFGHTLAHAVEKEIGWSHGQAVAWGMNLATEVSTRLGFLRKEDASEILNFLQQSFPFLRENRVGPSCLPKIFDRLEADKKKEAKKINFVVLRRIGQAWVHQMSLQELKEVVHDLC